MIREVAIEPDLLVEFAKKPELYLYLLRDGFGLGEPRILSRYPTNWTERVLNRFRSEWSRLEAEATTDEAKGRLQFRRTKFEALLVSLCEVSIDRGDLKYHEPTGWLQNTLKHSPEPIQAILAAEAQGVPGHVFVGDDFFESPRWKLDKSCHVRRDTVTLVAAIAPLLERCSRVILVDPFFHPDSRHHMDALRGFLQALRGRRSRPHLERFELLATKRRDKKNLGWSYFEEECRTKIEPLLPFGIKMRIAWIEELESSVGEQLHNRYVLTNLGGVVFGIGLDAGPKTTADDLSLMSRPQYEKRWEQYAGSATAFKSNPAQAVVLERKPPQLQQVPPLAPSRGGRR